jgi:hypothetical protein
MYLQKVTSKKNRKQLYCVGVLKITDEKIRIRILFPEVRILRSGSVPNCHESGTLPGARPVS